MESWASVPLIVPSGRGETYGPPSRRPSGLSTDRIRSHPRMDLSFPRTIHDEKSTMKSESRSSWTGRSLAPHKLFGIGGERCSFVRPHRKAFIHIHVHN